MPWYYYVLHFIGGVFLANGVPHFVQGICGNRFQTPFASPPGVGESSAVVNVLWGWVNLLIGGLLLRLVFPPLLTPLFDLVLDVPKVQVEAQRKRVEKEKEQLEKNIANSGRQLADEEFVSRAPAAVVESLGRKLVEYKAQLEKVNAALDGLA